MNAIGREGIAGQRETHRGGSVAGRWPDHQEGSAAGQRETVAKGAG